MDLAAKDAAGTETQQLGADKEDGNKIIISTRLINEPFEYKKAFR